MRFTLQPGRWYACELIGEEFAEDKSSYSPIKIGKIEPLHQGNRTFRLHFYHANYPEDVRNKYYLLRVILRGESLLIARSIEHDPIRLLQIYELDANWLRRHFLRSPVEIGNVQTWLDRNAE